MIIIVMITVLPFLIEEFLAASMAVIILIINSQLLQSSEIIIKDLYINIIPKEIKIKN
ncbi:MAG: sodium:solute symporter family transporter [Arsenophonus sp. NC-PE1-MAG3]